MYRQDRGQGIIIYLHVPQLPQHKQVKKRHSGCKNMKKIESPNFSSKGKLAGSQAGRLMRASKKEQRGLAEALPKKVAL